MPCLIYPPLGPNGALSSRYGVRPGRASGIPTFHAGLDFRARPGDAVFSMLSGRVALEAADALRNGPMNGYGNALDVELDESYGPLIRRVYGSGVSKLWALYAHMRSIMPVGDRVGVGEPIGAVGSTTNGKFPGMGAHLHNELRHAGAGGRAPFPGPYRTNNVDPEPFYAELGLRFGPRGVFEFDQQRACGGYA